MPEVPVNWTLPENKNKDFWEKVPKIAYPAELLDLIGYYDSQKEALVDENGKTIVEKIGKNNKHDILIAYPESRREEKLFYEFDKFLREMHVSLQKIEGSRNPEELDNWTKMIKDREVILFAEIATFFDTLRMRALRMALNEFNTSYSRERTMLMEKIREVNSDDR